MLPHRRLICRILLHIYLSFAGAGEIPPGPGAGVEGNRGEDVSLRRNLCTPGGGTVWFRKVRGSLDLALRCPDPQLESTCCGGLSSALPLPLACLLGALAALPVGPVLVVLKYIGSFGKTVFFPRDLMGLFLVLLGTGALYVLLTRWLPLRFQRFRLVDAVLVALRLVWWWAGTTAASQAVTELYRLLTILVVPMLFRIYRRSLHWFLALGGLWDRPGMVAGLVRYHLALRFGLPRLGLVSARWEDGVLIVAGPFDPSDEKRTVDLVKQGDPL